MASLPDLPGPSATGRLALNFLGGFAVTRDGLPLTGFAYDKVRALLAYLASESSKAHGRERLAGMFWPEARGELARSNLRRTFHHLRKALGEEAGDSLLSDKKDLAFNRALPCLIDIEYFLQPLPVCSDTAGCADCLAQLEAQLALYHGPFLDGLNVPDAPDFHDWLDNRREGLQRQLLSLLRQLAQCHEKLGQPLRAIPLLQREISFDPWAEEAHRRLMRLFAASGQTAAALAQFESCQAALQRDLGLEPEPATLALLRRIRQGELALVAGAELPLQHPERRQVCVLMCELETPEGEDPELFAAVLGGALAHCIDIVNTHGGYCTPLHLGRLLAYFGYPSAQEHAPRQTLEAALRLLAASAEHPGLRMRLGLHAGWAVSDTRFSSPDATGVISRQAGRLTDLAPWGEAAVSPELRVLSEGFFLLTPPLCLQGVNLQLLRGRSGAAHRLEAAALRQTPMVGRRREMRLLNMLWERARQGQRQALLLQGEPGIGKSRLIQTLLHEVEASGGLWRKLRCQPEFQHTPYFPVIDFLQRQLDLQLASAPAGRSRSQVLADWLAPAGSPLLAHWPAIAGLLNLALAGQPEIAAASRKKQTEAALFAMLDALARQQTILLVLEDIHWADPSTLELLAHYLEHGRTPVFLLLTSRTEAPPPLRLKQLALAPLPARQAAQLAQLAVGGAGLGQVALQAVLARADGVPLYIEEMARALDESREQPIPGTLWHLLAVRLEAVGEAKRLAQQASVIGRNFRLDLLARLWDGEAALVTPGLARLTEAGLLQPQGGGHYRFKHALIRDAAYQILPLPERRVIHGRLAALYRSTFAELVADTPEALAQHLAMAGQPLAAAEAWLHAGRMAAGRSAHPEAVFHFQAGLAQLSGLAAEAGAALELSLQAALGTTLVAMKGYGAEEAKVCFSRALALSRASADHAELFLVTWGLWLGGRSCTPEAYPLEFTHKLERIAQASGDPEQAMQVHYAYGNNLFWLARYGEARQHLMQAVVIGQGLSSARLVNTYGEDTGISSQAFLAWIDWIEGDHERALATGEAAVAAARELGHAHTLCFALTFQAVLQRFLNRPRETEQLAGQLLELAQQHELSLWIAAASALLGWAATAQGRFEALEMIRQSVEAARKAMLVVEGTFIAFLIDALFGFADYPACVALADDIIPRCQTHGDLYFLPEFLRQRGEALLHLGPDREDEARQNLRDAAALAIAQGAKSLHLRVLMSQVVHAPDEAAAQLARQQLAALLEQFSRGWQSPDLLAAGALLAEPVG